MTRASINARRSPIDDADVVQFLATAPRRFEATTDARAAYAGADYVIVATPTDYDPDTNKFNTASVESVVRAVMAVNSTSSMTPEFWINLQAQYDLEVAERAAGKEIAKAVVPLAA